MTDTQAPPAAPRRRVLVLFGVLLAFLLAVLLEGGARLWSAYRERRDRAAWSALREQPLTAAEVEAKSRELGLDAYEQADPVRPGRWRLRPGYHATFAEMLEAKRAAGRRLTVSHMEEAGPRLGIAPGETAVEVNGDGFRGPALDPTHARFRVLAIGDSTTFGTPLAERYTYPRALERALASLGRSVEVINAGVEGYSPSDVLARIDELQALGPDLVTIYIGWNALYREDYLADASGLRRYLHSVRLFARAAEALRQRLGNKRAAATWALERQKHPDRTAGELVLLEGYEPSFLPQVGETIDRMRTAGRRVVILTLPGLYQTARDPSKRAIAIGHLPEFTDNPLVLARMAERYNDALRRLASEKAVELVDLEAWGRAALDPPEAHFIDSVHLDELSQERLGVFLAGALVPLVAGEGAARASGR